MKPTPPLGSNPQDTASGPMHIDWIRWFESLKTAVENLSTQTYAPVTPSALTRANDTNVTVTLTGSPTVALLAPVLMTMGWTGVLAVSRGGTGTGTAFTAGSVIFAGPSGVYAQDNANLFWEDTNNLLGVGTASPVTAHRVTVDTRPASGGAIRVRNGDATRYRSDYTIGASGAQLNAFDDTGGVFIPLAIEGSVVQLATVAGNKVGVARGTATALLHIAAGSAAATTAPLKFTSGPLLGTAEAGAMEFLTDGYFLTITTGAARKGIVLDDGTSLTAGRVPFVAAGGRLTDDADLTFATDTLTATKVLAPTSVSTPSLISTTALTITPASGSNLNVSLATTGDLAVNVNQLYVDTSAARVGINNASPGSALDVVGKVSINNSALGGLSLDVFNSSVGTGSMTTYQANGITSGGKIINIAAGGSAVAGTLYGLSYSASSTGSARVTVQQNSTGDATYECLVLSTGDARSLYNINGGQAWSVGLDNSDSDSFKISGSSTLGTSDFITILTGGNVGLQVGTPTAILHLKAGTTAASTAPLKFNSGSLQTTAEAGAVEFLTDGFYATITTGAARKGIVLDDGTALTSGRVPFATTNGRLTDDADLTFATDTLTATKVSAPTSVSTGTLAQTGKTTTYNNVATAGWGEPAIYGSGRSTAQVAAVASVAAYTCGAADGSFIVSMNVNVTTSTTHNFTAECAYTDETNAARVLTLTFSQLAGVFVTAITNVTGAGPYEGVPMHIRVKASTAITLRTQAAGTYTTVVYNVEGMIEQVA